MEDLIILILTGLTLFVTYITGSLIEKAHYKKIKKREKALLGKTMVTYGVKNWDNTKKVKKVELVSGEAVISVDYFKTYVASLKNLFGGKLNSIESILDRGRREAILRMREKAIGANFIVNTKIEQIMMNDTSNKNENPKCALIVYGTAITYE